MKLCIKAKKHCELNPTVLQNNCGGRTRTYDLRVMSPTSYQLLYSAMYAHDRTRTGMAVNPRILSPLRLPISSHEQVIYYCQLQPVWR